MVSSAPFFLLGLELIGMGVLFCFAPEKLRDAGFRQDASPGASLAGLLLFGGSGGLLAWCGWRLTRLDRGALNIAHALALVMAGLFWKRIFVDGDPSLFNWTVLATSLAVVGYLGIPAVRRLFPKKERHSGEFSA